MLVIHKVFQSVAEMDKNNLQKPPDAIKSTGSLAIWFKFSLQNRGHFSQQGCEGKKGYKRSCVFKFLCNDKATLNREVATLQLGNAPGLLLPLPPGIRRKGTMKGKDNIHLDEYLLTLLRGSLARHTRRTEQIWRTASPDILLMRTMRCQTHKGLSFSCH